MLKDIIRHRSLIWEMVRRDLRSRYAGSTLGVAWAVLQPLVLIGVYATVFGSFAKDRLAGMGAPASQTSWENYIVFLCIGIIVWNLFQESTNRGAHTFVENANLIKKVAFPEHILPVVIIGSNLVRFGIELLLFTALASALGYFPGWLLLLLPAVLVLQSVFILGLSLTLATLNVFFRDIGHITSVGLFVLFWLTPIVIPQHMLPHWYQSTVLHVHPIHHMIAMWRDIFLNHVVPDPESFIVFALLACLSIWVGKTVYSRMYREIPDFI